MKTYSEKLKSPKWQKKRLEVLNRDSFKCTVCSDDETELHIHHLKYTGEPYDAPIEDLQTLCKCCHEFIEVNKGINIVKGVKHKSAIVYHGIYTSGECITIFKSLIDDDQVPISFGKNSSIIKTLNEFNEL